MQVVLWIFSALGFVLTVIEIAMGLPTLRTFWRWAKRRVGTKLMRVADRRMPFRWCQVNMQTGEKIWPGGEYTPAELKRRNRWAAVSRFAGWLMRDPHAPPSLPYRFRQRLRALGLEDFERVIEERRRGP